MKIIRARIYAVELPTKGGGYRRTTGCGEVCPIGTHYGRGWSTPAKHRLNATDLTDDVETALADGYVRAEGGRLGFSDAPGPGLTPRMEALGAVVA